MHSSRVRTARSLLYGGGLCPGGLCLAEGSLSSRGISVQGGLCPVGSLSRGSLGGLCPGGSISRGFSVLGGLPDRTPPLWTESQTGVKTLPWRNFIAGGKNRDSINKMTDSFESPKCSKLNAIMIHIIGGSAASYLTGTVACIDGFSIKLLTKWARGALWISAKVIDIK